MANRPVNSEMVIVTVAVRDVLCDARCPNCVRRFRAGDEVFLSLDERVALHVECVIGLALVATLRPPSEVAIAAEYRQNREALIERMKERSDG